MKTIILTLLISCIAAYSAFAQNKKQTKYFGQTPPGLNTEIFAPGIISTQFNERGLVFSPDGKELFFEKWGWPWSSVIVHMKVENGSWSKPEIADFSGVPDYGDGNPFYSYDGKKLFFSSQNPLDNDIEKLKHSDIMFSEKINGKWSQPIKLGANVNSDKYDGYPSLSKNGNLYFSSNREGSDGHDIWFCKWENGKYSEAVCLPAPINTSYFDGHPCISADESYLIMTSDRPGDLGELDIWVSFKLDNGIWTEPKNLGEKVNSKKHEADPTISKDGKYLFWMSERENKWPYEIRKYEIDEFDEILRRPGYENNDVYWIDIRIIEQYRNK